MLRDGIVKLMDHGGKLLGFLTAIAGVISIFLMGKGIVTYTLLLIACFLIELWLLGILRQEETTQAARWAITLLALLPLGLAIWLIATFVREASVRVYSARYPFTSTGIAVEASDFIGITALGANPQWDCGRTEMTGPEGFFDEGYSDTVFEQANACALIGSISASSPDVYFLVGPQTARSVSTSGTLYLGCNDSIPRFGDNDTDSYLEVKVVVVKWLNLFPILLALLDILLAVIALVPRLRRRVFPPAPTASRGRAVPE